MKRFAVIFMAILIGVSAGCAKKENKEAQGQQVTKKVSGGSLIDPVDHKPVDVSASKFSYIYNDIEYNFNTRENMEAFMKDPDKYLKKD